MWKAMQKVKIRENRNGKIIFWYTMRLWIQLNSRIKRLNCEGYLNTFDKDHHKIENIFELKQ